MSEVKSRAVKGVLWSVVDSVAGQGINFFVGLVLARILSPREFGLIGMIAVFIAVSQSFIDSGFANALIRKKNCSQKDYSTVFYFNLAVGILVFFSLYLSAPLISIFFKEPQLTQIVRVLGIVLLVDAVAIIHRTILTKNINFKLQSRISIISSVFAGIVSIVLAYNAFGVWSLVVLQLLKQATSSVLLWKWNKWKPSLVFSKTSFKELFGFGSKLLVSGIIDVLYRNIYILIIGKFSSAKQLGFYTRADQFRNLPSQNLTFVLSRVSFPILAEIQDNTVKLKDGYRKILKLTMYISLLLMVGMAAVAEPMVISLIGIQWEESIIYLQLLSFVGAMYPLHALNLTILQVKGRSDLFLKLEIIKKTLAVPTIFLGIFFGIKVMIFGMWFNSITAFFMNSYWSGKQIEYKVMDQLKDIYADIVLACIMGLVVYAVGHLISMSPIYELTLQVIVGVIVVITLSELFKIKSYLELKGIVLKKKF